MLSINCRACNTTTYTSVLKAHVTTCSVCVRTLEMAEASTNSTLPPFKDASTHTSADDLKKLIVGKVIPVWQTFMSVENHADVPREFGKNLCACIPCRLVKTFDQFVEGGCENCPFLAMDNDRERCMDCTTVAFQGMITVIDPAASWAAKWLHVSKFVPGCYALSVQGDLPAHIEDILAEHRITWHKSVD